MKIDWIIFLTAGVLLLYPLDRLLPANMKCRTSDALTDPAAKHRRKWWRWQPELWLDVLRIAVAAWFVDLAIEAETTKLNWAATTLVGAVTAVGVCCQMRTRREEDVVFVPVTYMLGAMLALLPLAATAAVFVLAMAALLAFRSYVAFLLTGILLTTGLTYLLGGDFLMGLMVSAVYLVALMASILMEGELVLPVRNLSKAVRTSVTVRD